MKLAGWGTAPISAAFSKRHVVSIHAIHRQDHPALQLTGVGIQAQVHGQLVSAQICTITHDDEGIHIWMTDKPFIQAGI